MILKFKINVDKCVKVCYNVLKLNAMEDNVCTRLKSVFVSLMRMLN